MGTEEEDLQHRYEVATENGRGRTISLGAQDVSRLDGPWSNSYVELLSPLWRDGLCSGLSNNLYPSCLCAFCIPCVIGSQLSNRLEMHSCCSTLSFYLSVLGIVLIIFIYAGLNTILIYYLLLCYLAWATRDRLRTALKIPGHAVSDCVLSFGLMPCVMAQNARQLYEYQSVCICSDPGIYSMSGLPSTNQNVLPQPPDTQEIRPTQVVSAHPLEVVSSAPVR